ncbi:sulfatase [Blastopirellula marina]|uniref:Iduronate sulfatase n=1 Tax=Blastopirellula marina TaxID=124 RepID=A0A2S8GL31_9BACT|nr:sulfatase [Blastopirellula marina]PQO45100.1 iduronate sulfatase [Blastopirellula marina]
MPRLLTLAVALCAALSFAVGAFAQERQPNVLFIAVDDLRTELGCYGADYIHSPNIDRLAATGTVFKRAYCQQAVCSPSRTSLMTGLRPDSTGVYDLVTHFRKNVPDVVTLGQHFKQNGYYSVSMGKIYHGGYDDQPTWSEPARKPKGGSGYVLAENKQMVAARRDEAKQRGLKGVQLSRAARGPATEMGDVKDEAYTDGAVANLAVQTMRELSKRDEPFFLAVGFVKPHLPFTAPKKYWDMYDRDKIELAENPFPPKNVTPYSLTTWGEMRVYDGIPKKGDLTDEKARELKHGYYACTSFTDANVGKLLSELDKLNLADDTIVVLWGDHGWKLGEHNCWCKHTNFENDANAPLIIRAPGQKSPGAKTDALVEFVDIYPTLCELADLPLPEHLEGTSAAPLLDTPDAKWKPAAFSQYPRGRDIMGYTMKTDRYRFTAWKNKKSGEVVATELYDHHVDPAENDNVAGAAENKELVAQLQQQLDAGWKAVKPK